jgi:hypothetical protein
VDSTHIDLLSTPDAPTYTGNTISGSAYVSSLSSINAVMPGMTFTSPCFTGTRTVKHVAFVSQAIIADATATSTTTGCNLTFANPAFAAGGTPYVQFNAYGGLHGIGIEVSTGGGMIAHNVFVWCHDTAYQYDASTGPTHMDGVSADCNPAEYRYNRIGINFLPGTFGNKVSGNGFTCGGTFVVNQNGQASTLANIVESGRTGCWLLGALENTSGSIVLSGVVDPDNASGGESAYNGDLFANNNNGTSIVLANGTNIANGVFWGANGTSGGLILDSGSTLNANRVNTVPAQPGQAAQVVASGPDTNIGIQFIPKGSFGTVYSPHFTAIGAALTVAPGQIAYGGTTVANTSCGTLTGSAGCIVINVGGTQHFIPFY